MGRAYSEDLRLQVLKALDGGMSKMAAHRLFGISRSTLDDWLQLREQTGRVSAILYRRGRLPALNDAQALAAFVQSQPDRTLAEMAQAWHQAGGPKLGADTFSRSLRRLGYTRKKRAFSCASAANTSEANGSNLSPQSRPHAVFIWTRLEPTTP